MVEVGLKVALIPLGMDLQLVRSKQTMSSRIGMRVLCSINTPRFFPSLFGDVVLNILVGSYFSMIAVLLQNPIECNRG